jgi:hypothetical protein
MAEEAGALDVRWVDREYGDAPLPDDRLIARQLMVGRTLAVAPAQALPALFDDAGLQGLYGLVHNPRVTPTAILAPHVAATAARARAARRVLALHDGTEVEPVRAAKLARLRPGQRGFLAHVSLLVEADGAPLGVAALATWQRSPATRSRTAAGRRKNGAECAQLAARESAVWRDGVAAVAAALGPDVDVVHVMDRGSDSYALLAWLAAAGHRYVLRIARDRVTLDPDDDAVAARLSEVVATAPAQVTRVVTVAARAAKTAPKAARAAPPRAVARTARVAVATARVTLRRPYYLTDADAPPTRTVQVVSVIEHAPPAGEEPVAWVLVTSEPCVTTADLLAVVDAYAARWGIEVFFDALKNGCLVEARRFEDYASLVNVLALALPLAWQLARLRVLARQPTPRPATDVFTALQLVVLRACGRVALSAAPDAREALFALGKLGGALGKREAGWRILARALDKLIQLEAGWRAGRRAEEM